MTLSTTGWHEGEVTAVALNKASTGNVQIVVALKDEDGNGITAFLSTTDRALEYTEKKLIAMGWNPADYDYDLSKLNEPDCALVGMRDFKFEVVEQPDLNGDPQRRVGWIGEPGSGVGERLEAGEARSFAAELRKRLIAQRGKPTPKAAPATAGKKAAAGGAAPWDGR